MSNLTFKTSNVYPGNANQLKVGIMATFSLDVQIDGQTICRAKDLKIQKSKNGVFIASASRSYVDKKSGETRYISFFQLFPDEKDGASSRGIIEQVKRECENPKSNNTSSRSNTNSKSTSAPVNAAAPARSDSAW